MLCALLKLLFLIHGDISVTEYFKNNNYYPRIYYFICEVFNLMEFSEKEILFILNFLINIATDSSFYHTLEKHIFYQNVPNFYDETKGLSEIINLIEKKYQKLISYIVIINPFFIEMVFLSLYELKFNENIRNFYFYILNQMVISSNYNAQILARETFVEKIFVMLRIEMNYNLKCLIANFLLNILMNHMDISRIKSMNQAMRYDYYWKDVLKMFAKLKEENYKTNFFDFENFYFTLKLLFNVMEKIAKQ